MEAAKKEELHYACPLVPLLMHVCYWFNFFFNMIIFIIFLYLL